METDNDGAEPRSKTQILHDFKPRLTVRNTTEEIVVRDRLRSGIDEATVDRLMESMAKIGLQTPISVIDDGDDVVLVAGRHRLEAARRLNWMMIDCIEFKDASDARLWEISENLHRAELTALERSEHIAEWIRLSDAKLRQSDAVSGGRGKTGGVRAAARELGISEPEARRANRVNDLKPEAKQAARDTGLDDNRTVLLAAAREADPAAQLARIHAEADKREAHKANRETDKLMMDTRVDNIRTWLAARLDAAEMHALGEMTAGICDPLSRALMREVVAA